ncbi:MAG: ribosome maturation factor RimP [Brachyspira sp.]|nr:ribosome maturation factor RimP [Brachyspira sp.]
MVKPDVNRHDILEKITPLIENTTMRYGYVPIEIEFVKENHRWFLRIFLYSSEKDVTLDDCEKVTRSLSDFLDELIPVKYYLEVSSPGLERKFKSDKEFVIFKGKRISIKLKEPIEGEVEKIFKGEILDFDETEGLRFFRFDDGQELLIPRANIQSAKLYID